MENWNWKKKKKTARKYKSCSHRQNQRVLVLVNSWTHHKHFVAFLAATVLHLHNNHRCQLLPKMLRHQPIILCLVLLAWTSCEVTGVSICENVSNKSNLGSVFPPLQKDKRSLPAAVLGTPDNHGCANWCSKTTHCLKIYTCCCLVTEFPVFPVKFI